MEDMHGDDMRSVNDEARQRRRRWRGGRGGSGAVDVWVYFFMLLHAKRKDD
jgi:hypothetical protein